MPSRASTVYTVAGITVLGGLVAYAVYFDYKRRNDVEFRKKLRKEKKKASKTATQSQPETPASGGISPDDLRAALAKVRAEEVPATPEEKEQYFMSHVGIGEQLATKGPAFHLSAALSFYRAMRVYPSPVELIMIFQQTLPPELFKLVMELTNMDVQERVEGYYHVFPPKSMNVSVQEGKQKKKVLIAEKDFEAGDVIYMEEPVVTMLDFDLQSKGSHCTHCFRTLGEDSTFKTEDDHLGAIYCSRDCQTKSKAQSQNLLFGLEPPLPEELDNGLSALTKDDRDKAEAEYVKYLKEKAKLGPILAARLAARAIAIETAKLGTKAKEASPADLHQLCDDNADYSLNDHVERLRFIDIPADPEEHKLLRTVLATAVPGIEGSIADDRYAALLGKTTYNAYGVYFGEGRDDRPTFAERPEDQERTRTPHGTSRQIGSAFYIVSSYIGHSCSPSAKPTFSSGNADLTLVATQVIKKGDEITVSYVDVSEGEGESPEDARRRRRFELARGWRFKCECDRCLAEATESPANSEDDVSVEKDESKVEKTVERLENPAGAQHPEPLGPD